MTNNETTSSSSPIFFLVNAANETNNQIYTGKRKANETSASETPPPPPSLPPSSFFKLSSPIKSFHNLIFHNNTTPHRHNHQQTADNKRKENVSNELFNFNEPYQAKSFQFESNSCNNNNSNNRSVLLVDQPSFSIMKSIKGQELATNRQENNLVILNSNRNHPYIRPTNGQNENKTNNNNNNLFNNTAAININNSNGFDQKLNEKTNSNESSSNSSPNNNTRNSSSNAILAHLKSISPNFKSIFVRPKTHKPIDASALLNKTKLHNKNVSLPQLRRDEYSLANIQSSSLLFNSILPRIELTELRYNSSVDDILKKFANEDDVIRRTIKNYPHSRPTSDLNTGQSSSSSLNVNNVDKTSFVTGLLSADGSVESKLMYPSQFPKSQITVDMQTSSEQLQVKMDLHDLFE